MIRAWGSVRLADIEAAAPASWDISGATHVRVTLPALAEYEVEMQKRGFFWADRTLKASISLARCPIDFAKAARLPVEKTKEHREEILRIASSSFPYDRRFHVLPACNASVAALVLKEWVDALEDVLVCKLHGQVAGFLAFAQPSKDALFVRLAAVEKKYRLAGAALSLYSRACQEALARGCRKLEGRISSQNMAVLNLYAAFGAVFSEPMDIFLKEAGHDA